MIARLTLAVLVGGVAAGHLREKVTEILPARHAHRHHKHTAALLQQAHGTAANHAGVFENSGDLPSVPVSGVVASGIVENSGEYKDEVASTGGANPPAALVTSRAATKQAATASDDGDGGDAQDFIDGPAAPDQQETITREDMMESQNYNAPRNQSPALTQVQQQAPIAMEQETPARPAATAAMVQTKSASGQPTGVTRPKGWDQCLKFARYIKAQDVTGVELVRVWKSTCEPAVQSGSATERYRLMCNSLGGAVGPFAAQLDYNVENLCDSVLAVFHDVTAVDAKAR